MTADYYGGDSLELGGAIRLGEQEVFFVSAPPTHRYYWRSRVFDTYDRGRWTPAADKRLTTPDSPLDILYNPDDLGARELVKQEFTLGLNTSRLIYTAPQPLQVELPTRTDLRYIEDDAWNVSVIRPLKVIRRGDTYTAESLISTATATQLRAVPPIYPEWIQVLYINAPLSVTERTVQLTNQIVAQAGAVTVYDKTKAIEMWLRSNIVYNEIIPQPPLNQDPIDWVLFDLKEGYCEYYASAMIIMLRSLGIPARMAAGFSQGTWDGASQRYMIQERDAHTWVEVYFPGYGWIEFEPTAAQAPLNRIGDNEFLPQPTPLPAASPTPSPTVTPTTLPTTTVTPNQQQDSVVPTITPTFTPSPTATPIIVPTQPPPIRPPQRGLLSFLLPTLGLALLGLLLIILLVGIMVFIWWWWEWRGMKGLSPVARAYARLERFAALVGIRFRPQQTPEERRQNMLHDLPQSKRPVTAITRMYTVERYGPRKNPMEEPKTTQIAGRAWSEARSSILKRFLRRFVPWRRR